jgi:hypothetical protein
MWNYNKKTHDYNAERVLKIAGTLLLHLGYCAKLKKSPTTMEGVDSPQRETNCDSQLLGTTTEVEICLSRAAFTKHPCG